jgi:iron complex transport system permease protein
VRRKGITFLLLAALWLIIIGIAISLGSVTVPVLDVLRDAFAPPAARSTEFSTQSYILLHVRAPRIALCLLTGISLGMSGCVMQNLFRNPLASPYTLGVSSGASFGAALAMVLGIRVMNQNLLFTGYSIVAVNAFVFGASSLGLVYMVSVFSRNNMGTLILVGTAINSLFAAGVSILKYISGAEALKNLELWLMGGFWGANWNAAALLLPMILACLTVTLRFAWDFNAMNAGEEVASTMGVNTRVLKAVSLLLVTLASSITIAFAGIIGFVGLVAPHIARSLLGTDNRRLIPGSCLIGSILLLLSDTAARTILAPKEIPVGIITAIIGVPFFLFLLMRRRKQVWG